MAPGVTTKVIAACIALCAFAVAIVSGLFADNPAGTVLLRALVALVLGQLVGYVVGLVCERIITDAAENEQKNLHAARAAPSPSAPTTP